ncbi:MAG: zinc-ribbon domain-containing protein, partial [Methanoregula sp.]
MGEPDLRSDETVLVRTPGVFVKSIPFEGILTNKRIVLVDRAKNLLPPKEIPLATIKDIEGGENAIRDPIVTITVITRGGETRQMVLTFSRTAGGNRNKERDEWVKTLKENVSSSFEQVIRKGTPGFDQPHKKPEPVRSPRIDVTGAPVKPVVARPSQKKEVDTIHPIKKIIENAPSGAPTAAKEPVAPSPGFGTFCSRCGNKVPEGSGFCNRCGSSIIPPGSTTPVAPAAPVYRAPAPRPIDREIQSVEPLMERSSVKVPADPMRPGTPEPPVVQKPPQPARSPVYDNPPEPVAVP